MIKTIEKINDFFKTDIRKNPEEIFRVLKNIIPFKSGYIYFLNPKRLEYSFMPASCKYKLEINLQIQNTAFGTLVISRDEKFSTDETVIFNTCASIIANLIKDIEISKIMKMQVKALQEGIKETNDAYKSAKSQNEFFANFSHELRTPLNSIISSSELLSEQIFGTLNGKQIEYINDIRIAALHLLGMINDILDMARIEAKSMKLNLTQFNLSQPTNEVCNILKPLALKKNITITKDFDKEDLIKADYSKIQQIIFNLITNAIKYTPQNGTIKLSIYKKDKNIIFSVKDNGIGIAHNDHKKIFKKFVTLGGTKNSNGLGLTITNELVKLHNGTISLNSEPQQGSEFIVILPCLDL